MCREERPKCFIWWCIPQGYADDYLVWQHWKQADAIRLVALFRITSSKAGILRCLTNGFSTRFTCLMGTTGNLSCQIFTSKNWNGPSSGRCCSTSEMGLSKPLKGMCKKIRILQNSIQCIGCYFSSVANSVNQALCLTMRVFFYPSNTWLMMETCVYFNQHLILVYF